MNAGCALCGRSAFTRRLDVVDSDINATDIGDYNVRGVLRGVLLCPECIASRSIGQLLNLAGGVELVRGCLVQCAHRPPWWLSRALPGGPRMWSKVQCPACGGRASIQVISEAVERPRGAIWEGFRQAFGVLSWRREADYVDADNGDRGPDRAAMGVDSLRGVSVYEDSGPETALGDADYEAELSPVEAQIDAGE